MFCEDSQRSFVASSDPNIIIDAPEQVEESKANFDPKSPEEIAAEEEAWRQENIVMQRQPYSVEDDDYARAEVYQMELGEKMNPEISKSELGL